jgi:sugar phosphate isomerase/epimerase
MRNDIDGLKFGVVHPQLYPQVMNGEGPVVETAAALASEADITALEVTHVRDEVTRARLKLLLSSSSLKAVFSAIPAILRNKWDLGAAEATAREEALAGIRGMMEEARFLGARLFTLASGPDCAPEARPAAKARLVESLKGVCDEAGRLGLSVALEPLDREVDKKCLIGPTGEAVELAKQVKKDNFGLVLDLAHLLLQKESPGDAVSQARHFLLEAHVSNCVMAEGHPARGDQHPSFGTEGSLAGPEQVTEFLRALEKSGFFRKAGAGWLMLEVRPREEEYSAAVLAGGMRVVAEALKKV